MAKELYLLRHGVTPLNGLYVGSTDIALAKKGYEQVMRTGDILREKHIEQIFCSPMKRCRQTMELLQLNASFYMDKNLREIDFGRWEGLSFKEIARTDQELVENWCLEGELFCFPEGECIEAFNMRVEKFTRRVFKTLHDRILIIAHGGTIRHLLCIYLGLDPEKKMAFDIQPGCFATITLYDNNGVLTGLNIKG